MMAPRSVFFSSTSSDTTANRPAKNIHAVDLAANTSPSRDISGVRLSSAVDSAPSSTQPDGVLPKCDPRTTSIHRRSADNGKQTLRSSRTLPRPSPSAQKDRPLANSVASVLEATAIPVPRRTWASSRRLPQGTRTGNFNKLLVDGTKSRDDQLTEGPYNTALDILLSPPEENGESAMGTGCDAMTPPASLRSVSTESMLSLEHDLDSQYSTSLSSPPSSQRSPSDRRGRCPSHSENCASDHPLLEVESPVVRMDPAAHDPTGPDNSRKSSVAAQSFPRLGSAFKSNLTASLRAIKSAAQTVSAFATPSIQQDDFLIRSLFTISPKLTDDRRPPPMQEPPSPALRRYLNPITVSPAEMHIYHEHPHECSEAGSKCPVSIQMQTYRSPRSHGRNKGGFHFSVIDDLPYDPETAPMARQREPRENSDFLRMAVLEMNMKRSGKLRDDIPSRARIWLPPRRSRPHRFAPFGHCGHGGIAVPLRWIGVSVECA